MILPALALFLGASPLVVAYPALDKRTVTSLNQAAFQEAQQRDNTATRAFSSITIKTSSGQCLFVDELSGDFRANLTPIQVATCDGSVGQSWDVLTAGKHNNVPGSILIVNTLTQACLNFDPRRAAGNQVLLFSCGGRADGSGAVTNSQLFPFTGNAGPLALAPGNGPGICLTVKGTVIDQAGCNAADPNQSFSFGGSGAPVAAPVVSAAPTSAVPQVCAIPTTTSTTSPTVVATPPVAVATSPAAVATPSAVLAPTVVTPPTSSSVVAVSRARGILDPSAVAEANPRDNTATRAFTSVSIKSASGACLFIDPTAGDFRENLIPIVFKPCDGSINQKFDFITTGVHNDQPNSALIVSSLTQGCMNFDPRRAAGDTVMMFSCGGRADGSGKVTNSQLFPFTSGATSLSLQPKNGAGSVCLAANAAGRLDQTACNGGAGEVFTIV